MSHQDRPVPLLKFFCNSSSPARSCHRHLYCTTARGNAWQPWLHKTCCVGLGLLTLYNNAYCMQASRGTYTHVVMLTKVWTSAHAVHCTTHDTIT